jgi:hypothetical protein
METFSPNDHVIAINTDLSTPFCGPPDPSLHTFRFPNGPLRKGVIYHVESVRPSPDGNQSLGITGLPVFWGAHTIYWNSSRFRKVDTSRTHAPQKRHRKQTAAYSPAAASRINVSPQPTNNMTKCLNDILYSNDPSGLIKPIALIPEDVRGIEFVPLCLLGIFNPLGPTLVALNLIIKDDAPSGAILYTSLNPFNQSRLLTARAPSDPVGLFELFRSLHQVGNGLILGGRPDFVIQAMHQEDFDEAVQEMLFRFLSSVPSREPLPKVNQDYQNHWKDPWNRIPGMEEVLRQAIAGCDAKPVCEEPDQDDFDEWFSIVTDTDHFAAELVAVIEAWSGAIRMAKVLPHMPWEEAAAELGVLGFNLTNEIGRRQHA